MNATSQHAIKKTYFFGNRRYQHTAEVTTFFGTSKCRVTRFDPVGQYPPLVQMVDTYNEAHGIAKFHAMQMDAKYS